MPFTDAHLEALRAACDALFPSIRRADDADGFWARRASDLDVAESFAALIESLGDAERKEFRQLLDLLGSRLLGATWLGPLKPITDLTPEQRETLLQRWALSPLPQLRKGFATLKGVAAMFFYGDSEPGIPNPNWAAIGYPGPVSEPPAYVRPIEPLTLDRDVTLRCDTVVVGSGAGGGVVAGELAEAGHDVIVIEKGPYVDRDEFTHREAETMGRLYEQQGALATKSGSVSVLAGSCLGGGTTINWAGSFRTPEYILRQWADQHDAPHFRSPAFQQSIETLEQAMHVGADRGTRHNPQNQALWDGCTKLGYHVGEIPRNQRPPESEAEWKRIGFSPFGDRDGLKQGMLPTYLQRAVAHGARILADTTVERVTIANGRATGVVGTYEGVDGRRVRVTVQAERVVVAAGSIHTPALLLRSGIEHPHLGRHLFFHPTVAVAARYPDRMEPWYGPMMSAVSNEFAKLDGLYGPKLETPPTHAGLLGLALPWRSGEQHKTVMRHAAHIGSFIVLTRDRDGGRVTTNKQGGPVLHYSLSTFDRDHLLRGIAEACRIHLAAGAEEVYFPHNTAPTYQRVHGEAELERFLADIPNWGWKANRFPLFTAHQMGTCRMGGDAKRHPITPEGEVRGTKNLYVADASCFPESSGVNPMLSVQAIAHYTAQGLKAQTASPAPRRKASAAV
ncbi:MAG: GMC family oxidoreductase N-terminal domain-containing protein [Rhodothermales bacterium]